MAFTIQVLAFCKKGEVSETDVMHYIKLCRPYADVACVYLKSPSGDFANKKDLMEAEARIVLAKIPKDAGVVVLSEDGKRYASSHDFSQWVAKKQAQAKPLIFIIGGAYGCAPSLKIAAKETLSLSGLTFSHALAQLVLLEQIYRAFTILKGHPYHK